MKKILAITLAAAMVITMAACAKKEEAPAEETAAVTEAAAETAAEAAETEAAEDAEETEEGQWAGMPNPMVESDAQGVLEATGFSFNIPEGAADVQYFIIDGKLADVRFTDNGTNYTARMQAMNEFTDISVMYYEWTSEEDCIVNNCQGTVKTYLGEDGDIHEVLWYDVVPGVMNSLTAEAPDLGGLDIAVVAESVFRPLQGDADALPLDDGETRVIVEPNYVTKYEDGTENILCQLFTPVVLEKDYVETLKAGDTIELSQYPGLMDHVIETVEAQDNGSFIIDDYLTVEYNEDLGGFIMRGPDDDIVRYVSDYRSVICDSNTEIDDQMGEIFWSEEGRTAASVSEAAETYGQFDAVITAKGGHAEKAVILYHP